MRAFLLAWGERHPELVNLAWSYAGVIPVLPLSLLFAHLTDVHWAIGLSVSIGLGVAGALLGQLVLRPAWRARRARSKRLAWRDCEESRQLRSAAETFFMSQGQDPLRAAISGAELMDLAGKVLKGKRP